ncbi:MAG TPA: MraY family glycosyltransferase [Thermomicrobiales bacterium]|nr:MraY family glycosyltransferase [Thermomicrobiales bacterium]
MPDVVIAAITFLSAVAVTMFVMPRLITFAARYGLLHEPGDPRRVHKVAVPRIGGIAMFMGFIVALGVTLVLPVERYSEEVERLLLLAIGATVIVIAMFYDDVIGIGPGSKLLIQISVAALVILPRIHNEQSGIVIEQFNLPFVGTITLPLVVAFLFTGFWIVGMMNALNWSDGLDGLAGTIALSASTVLFLHTFFWPRGNPQFTISLLAIALCGAIVGFLPFNWHPGRIIMGDTGAMFLGFALATTSIIGGAKIATALLALGVPIVDTAWMIFSRVLAGRPPMEADRGHLHHRLLDAGWPQPRIVLTYGAVSFIAGVTGLLLPSRELKLAALIIVGLGVLATIAVLANTGGSKRMPGGKADPKLTVGVDDQTWSAK